MRKTLLFLGVMCVLAYHSCNTCSSRRQDVIIDLADLVVDSAYFDMARRVLYSLPTPIEMSMLVKNMGVPWNPALLNNPSNASNYLTSSQMALNFGVYAANLAYSALFEQSQMTLRYKLAINHLVEGLGLQSAINYNTLQELERNINDRDAVLRIISETYFSCAALLNENERYGLTLKILAGGWIESMFIATALLNENLTENESRMQQLVIDQVLTFEMMWQAMTDLQDQPGVDELFKDLSGLAQLFDKIGIFQSENVTRLAAGSDVTEIFSDNTTNVSREDFEAIRTQIQILRGNIINI